jgi:hypothetical protein
MTRHRDTHSRHALGYFRPGAGRMAGGAGLVGAHGEPEPFEYDAGDPGETIESRQAALVAQIARYAPVRAVSLEDMTTPLRDALHALPGVVRVDVSLSPARPSRRILQFLDWHLVDRDLLAKLDNRLDWELFLNEVEAAQSLTRPLLSNASRDITA